MIDQTDTNSIYLSHFDLFERSLNGSVERPLHELRRKALEQFLSLGFPTTRDEEWRYTNVSPIARASFRQVLGPEGKLPSDERVAEISFENPDICRLVFVNGHFAPEHSSIGELQQGVIATSLAQMLERNPEAVEQRLADAPDPASDAFLALNTAFIRDGAFIDIPNGVALEKPIHLLFLSTSSDTEGVVSHPRNLIAAGTNASATIIEEYAGVDDGTYFTNAVTEIVAGAGARIEHCKIQHESNEAFHVGSSRFRQGRDSHIASFSISFGSRLVRNNSEVVLEGEGSHCTLDGLYLAAGTEHVDNHTTIDHAVPHCTSHELYKGILDGRGRGVFSGKIIVRPDAQKTDSQQSNKNLLLSEEAVIDTKPQLEIFADDVKCTHGATVGQLDEDSLFYLRSRGIGVKEAEAILTYAFAADVIERVPIPAVHDHLIQLLDERIRK